MTPAQLEDASKPLASVGTGMGTGSEPGPSASSPQPSGKSPCLLSGITMSW